MSKALLLCLLCLLGPATSEAAPGGSSADFLKVAASPRSMGMGETGAGLANDAISALFLNPAGMARLTYPEAAFSYNHWYEGINLQHFAYAHPTRDWGTFGLGGSIMRVQSFQGFDNSGVKAGEVTAQDFSFKASYARRVWSQTDDLRYGVFAGAGGKYARSSLDTARAVAAMGDAGVIVVWPLGPGAIAAGASALSFGQNFQFDREKEKAPTVYGAGVSYAVPVYGDPLVVAYDVKKPRYESVRHHAGFELRIAHVLAWRLGLTSHQSLGFGYRAGVGFRIKNLDIDYALANYGRMGFTHLMGVSLRLGAPIEYTPSVTSEQEKARQRIAQARELSKDGRHVEAAERLNEALGLDPLNKEALRLLREVRDAMERKR